MSPLPTCAPILIRDCTVCRMEDSDVVRVRVVLDVAVDRQKWLAQTVDGYPATPTSGYSVDTPTRDQVRAVAEADVPQDVADYVWTDLQCAEYLKESGASVVLVRVVPLPAESSESSTAEDDGS